VVRILFLCVLICVLLCIFSWKSAGELLDDPTFYTHTSEYYITQSDVSAALSEDIGSYLDRMNDEYRKKLGRLTNESKRKMHVRIYKAESAYYEFVGNTISIGAFLPSKRLLCAYVGDWPRERLLRLLRHEGLHQFMYTHVTKRCPPWINEGLAECFEHGFEGGRGFRLDIIPQKHITSLREAVRNHRLIPLQKLLTLEQEEWNSNLENRPLALLQYAQAWSVVYYVMFKESAGNGDILMNYLGGIKKGKRGEDALRYAFGEEFDAFRKGWLEYIQKLAD